MTSLIFGIIFILVGLIVGIALSSSAKKSGKTGLKLGGVLVMTVGIIVGACLIVGSCVCSVSTGYTGIVTTFGKVEDYTLDAGVHSKAPWNKVIEMDNRVQKATAEFLCFSADIQEVSVKYTVNYQISKTNAQEIYKTIGVKYYDTVITPNVTESFKTVSAKYTAEELIGNRDKLANEIEEVLKNSLVKYNIEVVSTAIEDLDFSDAFTDAVEAKQVAAQNKLKAQTEQEQKTMEAQQSAERAKIEAEAKAEVAKIEADVKLYQAEKDAEANLKLNSSLTDKLLEYLIAKMSYEKWDGKLPETMLGDSDILYTLNNGEKLAD